MHTERLNPMAKLHWGIPRRALLVLQMQNTVFFRDHNIARLGKFVARLGLRTALQAPPPPLPSEILWHLDCAVSAS